MVCNRYGLGSSKHSHRFDMGMGLAPTAQMLYDSEMGTSRKLVHNNAEFILCTKFIDAEQAQKEAKAISGDGSPQHSGVFAWRGKAPTGPGSVKPNYSPGEVAAAGLLDDVDEDCDIPAGPWRSSHEEVERDVAA